MANAAKSIKYSDLFWIFFLGSIIGFILAFGYIETWSVGNHWLLFVTLLPCLCIVVIYI